MTILLYTRKIKKSTILEKILKNYYKKGENYVK